MEFATVGLDFTSAPLSFREKLAVAPDKLLSTSRDIITDIEVPEALVVSTCNRTEYYLYGENRTRIYDWLISKYDINNNDLHTYTYSYIKQAGVEHLMSLACGLKSMVVGEVEILGQLKQSYEVVSRYGCVAKFLSKLFQQSFATAKKVRGRTGLSVNPISVAYAAVKLASKIFSDISESTVMIIGAGDTARLILTHLIGSGVKNIIIANRTLERAEALVERIDLSRVAIKQIALSNIPKSLNLADIVISSTASPLPILGKGMVEAALKRRKRRPVCMVDVAIPRDIEPQVNELDDIYLYCLDDLQKIVAKNKILRLSAAEQARIIIEQEVDEFCSWWQAEKHIPSVCKLRESFHKDRHELLVYGQRELSLGKNPYEVLDKITNKLTNKLLHKPTTGMKQAALNSDKALFRNLENIFELEDS